MLTGPEPAVCGRPAFPNWIRERGAGCWAPPGRMMKWLTCRHWPYKNVSKLKESRGSGHVPRKTSFAGNETK